MSSGYPPETWIPTRLNASQGTEALPDAPFGMTQGRIYPSMYPLPGSSHPPLASPTNANFFGFPSFAPDYMPNYQSHNTIYSPAGFIPPMANPAFPSPMNNNNFRATRYPLHDTVVGNATGTTAPLPSEDVSHHEQPTPFTFQCPLPTQPEAALDHQQGQRHWQAVQEGLVVEEPPQEAGEVDREDYQTNEESHADLVAPEVGLYSDEWNNQVHLPEKKTTVHCCSNNPDTPCSGRGIVCLDNLTAFVDEYSAELSAEEIGNHIIAAIAPAPNAGQSAGQSSQVHTTDPVSFQHIPANWETTSSGSNTTASTSAHSSPSRFFLYPPSHFAAESSSMCSTSSSTGKRRRSEAHPEDRPNKQQREESTYAQGGLVNHIQPCSNHILDCRKKSRKKKDEGDYFCMICLILGKPCRPLSRKDALKRHIFLAHELFQILLRHPEFNLLKARRSNEFGDLRPLLAFCVALQLEAQQRGVQIRPGQDLTVIYPQFAGYRNIPNP